jgi:hypothetical protein
MSPSDTFLETERLLHAKLLQIATTPKPHRDLLLENVNWVAFGQ